jgi:hypothetical protein
VSARGGSLAHPKATGVLVGGVPLGMRRSGLVDKHGRRVVEHDPIDSQTVTRIREVRTEGHSLEGRKP